MGPVIQREGPMAKTTDRDLFDKLRARGLRKNAASNLAKAFGRADNSPPGKGARRAVSELRDLVSGPEERVAGEPAAPAPSAARRARRRRRRASARRTSAAARRRR